MDSSTVVKRLLSEDDDLYTTKVPLDIFSKGELDDHPKTVDVSFMIDIEARGWGIKSASVIIKSGQVLTIPCQFIGNDGYEEFDVTVALDQVTVIRESETPITIHELHLQLDEKNQVVYADRSTYLSVGGF